MSSREGRERKRDVFLSREENRGKNLAHMSHSHGAYGTLD